VLERGRATALFRGGVDPVQLYVSIAGIAYFYLSNTHTLSAIFGRDLMSPKARSERLSHMTRRDPRVPAAELNSRRRVAGLACGGLLPNNSPTSELTAGDKTDEDSPAAPSWPPPWPCRSPCWRSPATRTSRSA
jgi:hypothetical protein